MNCDISPENSSNVDITRFKTPDDIKLFIGRIRNNVMNCDISPENSSKVDITRFKTPDDIKLFIRKN